MRVFASLRFGAGGAQKEARALRAALAPLGIELCTYEGTNGCIVDNVFHLMSTCKYLCVFGTKHYGEDTGSLASTHEEIKYWQNNVSTDPSTIVRIRMIPFPPKNEPPRGGAMFDFIKAQLLFTLDDHQLLWLHGTPMPPHLPEEVARMIRNDDDGDEDFSPRPSAASRRSSDRASSRASRRKAHGSDEGCGERIVETDTETETLSPSPPLPPPPQTPPIVARRFSKGGPPPLVRAGAQACPMRKAPVLKAAAPCDKAASPLKAASLPPFGVQGMRATLGVRERVCRALDAFGDAPPCAANEHVGRVVDRLLVTLLGETAAKDHDAFHDKLARVEAHLGVA